MSYICRHGFEMHKCTKYFGQIWARDKGNQPGYVPPTQEERDELMGLAKDARNYEMCFTQTGMWWYQTLRTDVTHDGESRAQILESLAMDGL